MENKKIYLVIFEDNDCGACSLGGDAKAFLNREKAEAYAKELNADSFNEDYFFDDYIEDIGYHVHEIEISE